MSLFVSLNWQLFVKGQIDYCTSQYAVTKSNA